MSFASCIHAAPFPFDSYNNYCVVQDERENTSARWNQYLFYHLSKRAKMGALVSTDFPRDENHLKLSTHLDAKMGCDYKIEGTRRGIHLYAANEDIMLWLIYQFIAGVAERDQRFDASDLPPAIVSPIGCQGTMAFEWRSLYTPNNNDPERQPITATHHVDNNWGLWGHNLHKAVGMTPDMAATVDGKSNKEQYCFSSNDLFDALKEYIIDNYGYGKPGKGDFFTIMPNDNALVCTCDKCKQLGNTKTNATPAVTNMVKMLSRHFPNHLFFTTAYLTTKLAPTEKMPENTGVLVSAMDLPMRSEFAQTKGFKAFYDVIEQWRKVSDRIYVWDYGRNFDDYLTPFPFLTAFRARALYYNKVGIRGVFLNGSGYDYSTFDDLQTFVVTALLINPELEVEPLVTRFFKWYYPKTAELLTDFYLELERTTTKRQKALPFYGGILDSQRAFLDPQAFNRFWTALDKASKAVKGNERKRLNELLTAMNFTRLEIMRSQPKRDHDAVEEALEVMREYKESPAMSVYRESFGELEDYIDAWETQPQKVTGKDLLLGARITANDLGEESGDINWLTDGGYAFTSDYHTGWVVSPAGEWQMRITPITASRNEHASQLVCHFLQAPVWRMWLPTSIVVKQGDKEIGRLEVKDDQQITDRETLQRATLTVPLHACDPAHEISIVFNCPNKKRATLACDEIELR